MLVRIGTTLDGRVAGFDTCSARPLLLIGDVGRGKTTIARYLTRWWLADTMRHAHVYTQAPQEWADQRCEPQHTDLLQRPAGSNCRPGTCLIVVDDLDSIDDDRLVLLPRGAARTILIPHGGNDLGRRPLLGADPTCLGLVHPQHPGPSEAAVLQGQGRLDWPNGAVAVIPDQRGSIDFPCHRWQASAGTWAAVTR